MVNIVLIQLMVTLIFVLLAKISVKKFDPIEALNLTPGFYVNDTSGSILEVLARDLDKNKLLVSSENNPKKVYSVDYFTLDQNYTRLED